MNLHESDGPALQGNSDVAPSTHPSAADFIAYARLMNGECPTCQTVNAHDGSPRCKCLRDLSPMGGGPKP